MTWNTTNFTHPPEGKIVNTKISDKDGERNEQKMYRKGNLWFCLDGTYVYYKPTHWAYVSEYKYC